MFLLLERSHKVSSAHAQCVTLFILRALPNVLLLPLGGVLGGGNECMCLAELSIFLYDAHFPFLLKEEADGMSLHYILRIKFGAPSANGEIDILIP